MCYQIDQCRYIKTEPKTIDLSARLWEIEVDGKQNSVFPEGPVSKCFVVPRNSKVYFKKKKKSFALIYAGWFTNLPRFQGARPDHA